MDCRSIDVLCDEKHYVITVNYSKYVNLLYHFKLLHHFDVNWVLNDIIHEAAVLALAISCEV